MGGTAAGDEGGGGGGGGTVLWAGQGFRRGEYPHTREDSKFLMRYPWAIYGRSTADLWSNSPCPGTRPAEGTTRSSGWIS